MSMWQIEGLIEYGIRLVDKAVTTNEEKKTIIGNLYAVQQQYDCKFTNFRVMPILLQTGYTITIDYTAHPDYKGNEAYFEKLLKKKDIQFLNRDLKKKWSEKNDVVAYLEPSTGKIYIDYGSPLRKEEPALTIMEIYDLGLYLIREAHQQQDRDRVYEWTAYILKFGAISLDDDADAEELISRYFKEIKSIFYSYDYTDYKPVDEALTIFWPGSKDSDGYTEWAISEGGAEGQVLEYFFEKIA
ncbi:hypothetical protein SAMN05428949_6954 [Chitinophaga sp. YR627]|uniref:hypothetical protein n=1 Tax=Chitinophaga sp. YR627 TaxID=1881041 RepID=UPI0008F14E94|nr:hypothetical protein [Chitinophaga sp. YR627]SFO91340.1 hypothetical protein SAMN05428949_6954 [Chitinophaga sp. YR627]